MYTLRDIERHLAKCPLDEILEIFRILHSTYFNTQCGAVFDKPKDPSKCRIPIRNLIRDFTGNVTVGFHLECWLHKLGSRLTTINNWMKSTQFDLAPFEPLVVLILNHATDVEVLYSLIQLAKELETMNKATNKSTNKVTNKEYDYLLKKYIAKLEGRTLLPLRQPIKNSEDILRKELSSSFVFNARCFWEKFFEAPRLKGHCELISHEYLRRSVEAKFKFPTVLIKANICKWIKVIEEDLFSLHCEPLENLPTTAFVPSRKPFMDDFKGTKPQMLAAVQISVGQSKRQYNYFLKRPNVPPSDYHHWYDILLAGKLTKSTKPQLLEHSLQLSGYIQKVLLAQTLRNFMHGFIFSGKNLQLWKYDRSGQNSCSYIDTGKFPDKFIHVLAAYMLMSDEEHGFVPEIQYQSNLKIVVFKDSKPDERHELILHPDIIDQQKALVSRGTSCYQAINNSFVVKLSWKMPGDATEAGALKIEESTTGTVKLIESPNLVNISDHRKDPMIVDSMIKDSHQYEELLDSPLEKSGEFGEISKGSLGGTVDRKRKREVLFSEPEACYPNKRIGSLQGCKKDYHYDVEAFSEGNVAILATKHVNLSGMNGDQESKDSLERMPIVSEINHQADNQDIHEKQKTMEKNEAKERMKRIEISSNAVGVSTDDTPGSGETPGTIINLQDATAVAAIGAASLNVIKECVHSDVKNVKSEPANLQDCRFTAIAISPCGRPIQKFRSALDVITGLKEVIKVHRSLLIDAKILHREISLNSIFLTHSDDTNELGGTFINLDQATFLDEGDADRVEDIKMGTLEFMAMELMTEGRSLPWLSVKHTYRHDLESIFYVLVWMCIRFGWAKNKNIHRNITSKWYQGDIETIKVWKSIYMNEEKFEDEILPKFSPKFKDIKELVVKFWGVIFYSDKVFWTGAYKDHRTLYDPLITAFDDAIEKLKSAGEEAIS